MEFSLSIPWRNGGSSAARRAPAFVALLILIAGGASARNAPRPVQGAEDAGRLVRLWEHNPQLGLDAFSVSAANYVDWKRRSDAFEHLAAYLERSFQLGRGRKSEQVLGAGVSLDLFSLLGVEPLYGRLFFSDADNPEESLAVIISHSLWQRLFGGDPGIIGKTLTLDERRYTVIAVMPAAFRFPEQVDKPGDVRAPVWDQSVELWVPLSSDFRSSDRRNRPLGRGDRFLRVIGRLRSGVTLSEAQAQISDIARQLELEHPGTNKGWGVVVTPHGGPDRRPGL